MSECSKCGEKIKNNQFKIYRKQVLCRTCYLNRNKKKITEEATTEDIITEPTTESDTYVNGIDVGMDIKEE